MVCHYCGYETVQPKRCPNCSSNYILGFKAGTQQIERQLYELFPGIRVLRMDGDTTKQKLSEYPVGGLVYFSKNIKSADQLKEMLDTTRNTMIWWISMGRIGWVCLPEIRPSIPRPISWS